ncbi:MAG: ABC transporter permease [Chlamydiia bacterium]
MIALFVFLIYLFLYIPIVVLILFSFNSKSFPSPWEGFTMHWYKELLESKDLWASFTTSLTVSCLSTLLSLIMGVFFIYYISRRKKGESLVPLFYSNLIIPELVLAIGLVSYFSLFRVPLGFQTLLIAHTVLGLGFAIPILYVRYKELPPSLVEASLILGAGPTKTFFKITLPLLKPALLASGLLIFVISFDDFMFSYFCAGTSVETLSLYLISSIRFGISPVVNALSTLLLFLTIPLALLFFSSKKGTEVF